MKKNILYLSLFLFSCIQVNAQYYFSNDRYYETPVLYEVGVKAGVMNAMTDLGGKGGKRNRGMVQDLRWNTARPCYGAYLMVTYNHAISGRIEGTTGTVVGFDSVLKRYGDGQNLRYQRNLSFKSQISEVSFGVEAHPLLIFSNGDDLPVLSPYIVIGAGYFSFNPQAKLGNNWYELKPLHTEGQHFAEYPDRKEYDLHQVNLSGGMGLRMELGGMFNARIEFMNRKLFTDYLDDVSTNYIDPSLFYKYLPPTVATIADQLANRKKEIFPAINTQPGDPRGNPKKNDSYFTIELKLGVVLGRTQR